MSESTAIAPFPAGIDGVTDEWLSAALRRSGRLAAGEVAHIESCVPLKGGTAWTTVMYRMTLTGPESLPGSAVLKLPVSGAIRDVIDGIGAYACEVAFYRDLAGQVPVNVPDPLVAEFSADSGDFVLLIEDLAYLEPADQLAGLSLEHAAATVDALAKLHAWSWRHPRLDSLQDRFPLLDGPRGRALGAVFAGFYTAAWPQASEAIVDALPPAVRQLTDRLPEHLPALLSSLGSPRTITHGELRADNLFFSTAGEPTMIDFQTVAQRSGMVDVSYVLSQSVRTEVRRGHDEELVRRYWEGLRAGGVDDYSWNEAWLQYRLGIAYSFVWAGLAQGRREGLDERGLRLVDEMLSRGCAALEDNDSPGALGA